MPRKPCLDCGALHRNDGPRCGRHQTLWNVQRGSSTKRGYGSQWRMIREGVLNAYRSLHGDVCPGYEREQHEATDLTVDHITPKAYGGTDDISNLQVLCKSCNSAKRDRVKASTTGR